MAAYEWDASLETGNELVDGQHRHIYELINDLQASIVEKRDRAEQDAVLADLIATSQAHFTDEEQLMRSVGYPGMMGQRQQHREFISETRRLSEQYSSGEQRLPITLAIYLHNWLVMHMRNEDTKIVEHIRSRGGSAG